ncbi:hypothetical protein K461DRAFT_328734 [Myriangium duriaei CBS 260.36]|uniref:Zn(2)-C6 fungal-type domain-containing protein n=1 Tax=Myriangium duriaei CBS 260.36 TaxID=1168546 RepID=A0A9P4MIX6_9PEZI|nr:hypothetical protein K461DRAFT_328734 [Myriangium duriaei CBS 260.36]
MRVAKSCAACRKEKRRCERRLPGQACVACRQNSRPCSLTDTIWRPQVHGGPDSELAPDRNTVEHLLNLYVQHIHDRPHTLFHLPSLRDAVCHGGACKAVLYAIMALGARLSTYDELRTRSCHYAARSRELLKQKMETVSIENVQAGILIAEYAGQEGSRSTEALYFSLAIRTAQLLRLHSETTQGSCIVKEVGRRVYWSCYMADVWNNAGVGLPRQLHDAETPRMPMSELTFQALPHDLPAGGEDSEQTETIDGLWAWAIRLVRLFARIQDFHASLLSSTTSADQVTWTVNSIADAFALYQADLPPELVYNSDNLTAHVSKGIGSAFVALHLGFHHYSALLYFPFLDGHYSTTVLDATYAARCRSHASALSDMIKVSMESDCEVHYSSVGHMTCISSAVLLHTLLLGGETDLNVTRAQLHSNFRKLLELHKFWPCTEQTIERLIGFQNACMQSLDMHTHRVDRWMVRFLLNHALPLERKNGSKSGERLLCREPDNVQHPDRVGAALDPR